MDQTSKAALELYRQAAAQRDAGTLDASKFALGVPGIMPRVRLATDVNLDHHDPNCKRCNKGVRGFEVVGGERIPIVCVCVSRGGGVKADKLDEILGRSAPKPQRPNRAERHKAARVARHAAKRKLH